ncbi:uncharacterized protein [Oscarella lobularis]|uniref:uncharacterized protein n=1 Tax=Oscarella lobularis TaxID=121494 RepID=UPI00331415E6
MVRINAYSRPSYPVIKLHVRDPSFHFKVRLSAKSRQIIFALILLPSISDLAYSNQPIGLSLRVKRTRGDAVEYCLSETTVYIKENEFSIKLCLTYELNASKGKGTEAILFNGNETTRQNKDFSVTSIISETEGGITLEFRNAQFTANGEYTYVVRHANGTVWLTRTVTIIVLDEPLEEEIPASAGQNLTLECPAKQETVSWVEEKSGGVTAGDWKRNAGPRFMLQAKNTVIYKCAIFDYLEKKWDVYKIFNVSISTGPSEAPREDPKLVLAVTFLSIIVAIIIIILLCLVFKRRKKRRSLSGEVDGSDSESPPPVRTLDENKVDDCVHQTGEQYETQTPNETARIVTNVNEIETPIEENTPSGSQVLDKEIELKLLKQILQQERQNGGMIQENGKMMEEMLHKKQVTTGAETVLM